MPLSGIHRKLKDGLKRIYLIISEDLFLLQEARSLLIQAAKKNHNFDEHYIFSVEGSDFDWALIEREAQGVSLLASKKILDLRLMSDSLGKNGSKFLEDYANLHPDDLENQILIISMLEFNIQKKEYYKFNSKLKWFDALSKMGDLVQIGVPSREKLPVFLAERLKIYGLTASSEALNLLADYTEGNLLAAEQEIIKLNLIYNINYHLELLDVEKAIVHVAEYGLEELSEAMLKGQLKRAIFIIETLISEEFNIVYLAQHLTRDIRQLIAFLREKQKSNLTSFEIFKTLKIWNKERQNLITEAAQRIQRQKKLSILVKAFRKCFYIDKAIKGLEPHGDVKSELVKLVILIGK